MVGDRGVLTSARIEQTLRPAAGGRGRGRSDRNSFPDRQQLFRSREIREDPYRWRCRGDRPSGGRARGGRAVRMSGALVILPRGELPPAASPLRACMRYPSYLISSSHSGPCGGAVTSLQSCGLIHFGRPGEEPRGRLVVDFVITAAREASVSIQVGRPGRIDMPRASWRGYLRLSLVSCPIYRSPATGRTKPIRAKTPRRSPELSLV
jgi:hypothetical protein